MHLTTIILFVSVAVSLFVEFTQVKAQIIEESELRNLHHGNFKAFLTHLLNVTLSLATISVSGFIQCGFACLENVACISFNFAIVPDIYSKQHACHLLPTDKYKNPDYFVTSQQFHHYAIPSPCESHPCKYGKCSPLYHTNDYRCDCLDGSFAKSCLPVYQNCSVAPSKTGNYKILDKQLQPFSVFCDQINDGGGWTMVFKAVEGVTQPLVGPLWDSSETMAENITAALDTTASYHGHYKNRIVNNWHEFDPQEARLVLYQNGSEVLSMKFIASGTSKLDWFSKDNLLSSPWIDLKNASSLQHFEIMGSFNRSFEISHKYGGCPMDTGWLVIGGTLCTWERHDRDITPSIQFNKAKVVINRNDFANVGIADVLAVFIR